MATLDDKNMENSRFTSEFQKLIKDKTFNDQKVDTDLYVNLAEKGVVCLGVSENGKATFEIPGDAETLEGVDVITCDTLFDTHNNPILTAYKCLSCDNFFESTSESYSFCPHCGRPIKTIWTDLDEYKTNGNKSQSKMTPDLMQALLNGMQA